MKRILSVLCILAMLVGVLSACDLHEHTFDTENWTHDDDYHWHACTFIAGCNEQSDKTEHDFEVQIDEDGKPVNRCKVCGAVNDKVSTAPEHDHIFDEKLSFGDNFHWYACIAEGCYEMKDKTEHIFGNPEVSYADNKITIKYICVDCGYEKIEEQEVKTEVDDALSWDDAFKNFKLINFTMDVFMVHVNGDQQHNHCVVTETEAYYCIPGGTEFYTVPAGDGTYRTYYRYEEGKFVILDDTSNEYLIGAQTETVLQISFEQNFDKFVYDAETGSYVCAEVIEATCYGFDGSDYGVIYCYNSVVKITDGKITYIGASYYFDDKDEDIDYSFCYYNIGMSSVEIPQSIIDNAIPESSAQE